MALDFLCPFPLQGLGKQPSSLFSKRYFTHEKQIRLKKYVFGTLSPCPIHKPTTKHWLIKRTLAELTTEDKITWSQRTDQNKAEIT